MDAKEKVDSELSWGFYGSDSRSYEYDLFDSDYKDDIYSSILNEFGWNINPAGFRSDATTVEKSRDSGSSTAVAAANPLPERVNRNMNMNKGKRQGEKRNGEARYAFVTKSEIDHLEDGYRWRKYGQKAVKNSPFPRSYYRCSESKCRVKKRVERSWEDSSVVITTYEGQHCHHHSLGFQFQRGLDRSKAAAASHSAPSNSRTPRR